MNRALVPLLGLGLVGLLTACPDTTSPRFVTVLIENTVQTASGSTPCTAGLSVHVSSQGFESDSPAVMPGDTQFWTAPIGTLGHSDPVTVTATCATGGTPGTSRIGFAVQSTPFVRIAAPDGQAHDYVLQAPGPTVQKTN
ncbi:MAG TPA: hypothetical protein VHN99_08645 [Deinococcales bacterium]|nr:hypothetical protein [Deinococcales bacterium]